MLNKLILASVLVAGVLFIQNDTSIAATKYWDGASTGTMSNPLNWDNDTAPVAGDDLVFGQGQDFVNVTVTNDMAAAFASVTITSNISGSLVIDGQTFNVERMHLNKGTINSNADVVLSDVTGGNAQITTATQYDSVQFLGNLTLTQTTDFSGAGIIRLDSAIDKNILGSGTINTSGAINVLFGSDIVGNANTAPSTLNANGTGLIQFSSTSFPSNAQINASAGYNIALWPGTYTYAFSLAGGGTLGAPALLNGESVPASNKQVILDNSLTLTGADAIYNDNHGYSDLVINGAFTGGQKFTIPAGNTGGVIVNSNTNSSSMPNGTTAPAVMTNTLVDAAPGTALEVFANGIVVVSGSRGATNVYRGGTLRGTGTVGNLDIGLGGRLAPGNSPGCLNSGNTIISGIFDAELGGTTACSGYDQLVVTGAVDVTGATLNTSRYNNFEPALNDVFTIISNDGGDAITGTFSGLAEGGTFTLNGYTFRISYIGGDGNDVTLTVTQVASNAPTTDPQATTSQGVVPGTPNTGMALFMANPLATLFGTIVSAGSLVVLGRKYSKFAR